MVKQNENNFKLSQIIAKKQLQSTNHKMNIILFQIDFQIANKVSSSSSFGWVRAEVIGAMFNGVFLLTVCFNILMEALGRIVHPRMMKDPLYVRKKLK